MDFKSRESGRPLPKQGTEGVRDSYLQESEHDILRCFSAIVINISWVRVASPSYPLSPGLFSGPHFLPYAMFCDISITDMPLVNISENE